MTELGITQEYLLLAVNDRGRFSPLNPQQPICFVAAALGELTEAGCIAFSGEKVGLAGPLPEGLRCLKPLYDFIDRPRPVPLSMVLRDFAPDGPKLAELAEAVGESLEALRLAAPQRALAGRVRPVAAAGHSLGEFAALAAAGVLDEESVLQIVSLRGRLMAEADPDGRGGMAAILKLSLEQVEGVVREAAEESGLPLIIANYNTPGQYVISGDKEAVALACGKVRPLKGRAVELKVSGAFHSPLMEKANRELEPLLRKAVWRRPRFAVYANLHGRGLTDGESLKESLLRQMVSSVRWIETMRQQYADGVRCWLELGPKAVLGKMVGQCLDQLDEATRADLRVMLVDSLESVENLNV